MPRLSGASAGKNEAAQKGGVCAYVGVHLQGVIVTNLSS